jgi:hypothetical protein
VPVSLTPLQLGEMLPEIGEARIDGQGSHSSAAGSLQAFDGCLWSELLEQARIVRNAAVCGRQELLSNEGRSGAGHEGKGLDVACSTAQLTAFVILSPMRPIQRGRGFPASP